MSDLTLIGREPESRELRVEICLNRPALISFTFHSEDVMFGLQVWGKTVCPDRITHHPVLIAVGVFRSWFSHFVALTCNLI